MFARYQAGIESHEGEAGIKTAISKLWRRWSFWLLLAVLLLPMLVSCVWYARKAQQQRLNHALIAAIKKNDTLTAIALLDAGADANTTDRLEPPITLKSILADFWNRMQGNKPPTDTKYYPPALLLPYLEETASRIGRMTIFDYITPSDNPELVKALLEHGANPYATDESGNTLLHHASTNKHVRTVKLLLEHRINPNVKNIEGTTPLMQAEDECARLLIEYRADVNGIDKGGQTPLMLASGSRKVLLLLEHRANVNARNRDEETPLFYHTIHEDIESVSALLKHGANINAQNRFGYTALRYAVRRRQYRGMIKLLLEHGAKAAIKDRAGHTLFNYITRPGHAEDKDYQEMIRLLKQTWTKELRSKGESGR